MSEQQRRVNPQSRPHGTRGKQTPPAEPVSEKPEHQHKPKADKASDKDGE